MRGRIVLLVVLAVVIGLVGIHALWSTNTPKAVGEPLTATPSDSSVRSVQGQPPRSPTASSPKARSPKVGTKSGGTTTSSGPKPPTPPASQPQPSTDPVRFGKVTTTPSGGVQTSVAGSDRRALTTTFDDREVQVDGSETGDRSRSFSITLPLTDGVKGDTLKVYVRGLAFAASGAYAQLTLKLNGLVTVRYYRSGFDDTFVETLEAPATAATTYRLEGVVKVHRNPGSDGAYLNVTSVDASISR